MGSSKGEHGLHGEDRQQGGLRDESSGTYDNAGLSQAPEKDEAQRTQHQRAQPGADVRQGVPDAEVVTANESEMPEGLRRSRKGPYDKNEGRNESSSHVPLAGRR